MANAVVKTKMWGFLKDVRKHLGELHVCTCAIKRSENQNVY